MGEDLKCALGKPKTDGVLFTMIPNVEDYQKALQFGLQLGKTVSKITLKVPQSLSFDLPTVGVEASSARSPFLPFHRNRGLND